MMFCPSSRMVSLPRSVACAAERCLAMSIAPELRLMTMVWLSGMTLSVTLSRYAPWPQ